MRKILKTFAANRLQFLHVNHQTNKKGLSIFFVDKEPGEKIDHPNIKGEPIVLSPDDAISTFYNSGLTYLVIGDFLITKN